MQRRHVQPSEEWRVTWQARSGMRSRTIAKSVFDCRCQVDDGVCKHMRWVYTVCKNNGIKLTDYCKGLNQESQSILRLKRQRRKAS